MAPDIRCNSPLAWLLAARPKTLTGAAVPVMMALALAYHDLYTTGRAFNITAGLLCLLFAFLMQIAANFVNDYFDFRQGSDDESRLGPKRACAMHWVTEKAMLRAIALTLCLACAAGFPLIYWGGWQLIAIGAMCVIFCILYTTYFSYRGLGDVLVLVFFGIVPVCTTYYIQTGCVTKEVFCSSVACGLVIDCLLMVNNYRDREGDKLHGKRTLVVLVGSSWAERLYWLLGLAGCLLGLVYLPQQRWATFCLPLIYLLLHTQTYRSMKRIHHGRALNAVLGETARNIFIFGVLFSAGVLVDVIDIF